MESVISTAERLRRIVGAVSGTHPPPCRWTQDAPACILSAARSVLTLTKASAMSWSGSAPTFNATSRKVRTLILVELIWLEKVLRWTLMSIARREYGTWLTKMLLRRLRIIWLTSRSAYSSLGAPSMAVLLALIVLLMPSV